MDGFGGRRHVMVAWLGLPCRAPTVWAAAGATREVPPAVSAAAPPVAANALLRKLRRSTSRSSSNFWRWNSKSGQLRSSPAHIGISPVLVIENVDADCLLIDVPSRT